MARWDGRSLVAYTRFDELVEANRVFVRLVTRNRASTCQTSGDCGGGPCVDGVCCENDCGGGSTSDCMACSVAAGGEEDGLCTLLRNRSTCGADAGAPDAAADAATPDASAPDAAPPDAAIDAAAPDAGTVDAAPADAPALADATPRVDASGADAASPAGPAGGCGCRVAGSEELPAPAWLLLAITLGMRLAVKRRPRV